MQHDFQSDIDLIQSIPAVHSILDVVCRTTGMGFAAVARVTEDRWVACSTRDDIGFGLAPGGELKVQTTICHEIQDHREPVVIDNVAEDELYRGHATPALYGLQSYVSFPIILADGRFFGTLCAIDAKPRKLTNPDTIGTFKLFADLIGQHIGAFDRMAEMTRMADERRDWERQQRMLQRELVHRMKNTLAMIQAIVTQSLRNAPSLDHAAKVVGDRIQALGRAQDALTEANWETSDIRDVVEAALGPHKDGGGRFAIEGPPIELTAQQGMGLALAIHELATNAAKYGALSNERGHVLVAWQHVDGRFHFQWEEDGGPTVVTPTSKGFGSRLTERVVPSYFQGTAKIEYAASGLRYRIDGDLVGFHPPHD